jgi:nicotinate-nucleotide adenylyltransferase
MVGCMCERSDLSMDNNYKRVGVFGGAFNPPHNGHVAAADTAIRSLSLDKLLVIPTGSSPHKTLADGSPNGFHRYKMTQLAFSNMEKVEVLDIELNRSGPSYTSDTLKEITRMYPLAELFLVVGADMFLTVQDWYCPEVIFRLSTLCALCRESGQLDDLIDHKDYLMEKFNAKSIILENEAIELSSTEIRNKVRICVDSDLVPPKVLEYILENNLYIKRDDTYPKLAEVKNIDDFQNVVGEVTYQKALSHIPPSRKAHVEGCVSEAIRLANHWGYDPQRAATAALFHDITKTHNLEEQLNLCRKYGIIPRTVDKVSFPTLHAITGAAAARELYGVDKGVESAIRYHTTGKANMDRLEIILYLADYIEPTRNFRGAAEVRYFAYKDLDFAMMIALKNTIEEVCRSCRHLSPDTVEAYNFYLSQCIRKPY